MQMVAHRRHADEELREEAALLPALGWVRALACFAVVEEQAAPERMTRSPEEQRLTRHLTTN
jgi:hypothetical protein